MAQQTSITITVTDSSDKKATKSLTYVNPQASDAQLYQTAQLFTAISNNNFIGAERIDRKTLAAANQGE